DPTSSRPRHLRRAGRWVRPLPAKYDAGSQSRNLARLQSCPLLLGEKAAEIAELAGSLQPLAPIHYDHFAVNVGCAIAHQESGQIGEFFEGAEPSQRIALHGHFLHVPTREQTREG